MRVPQSLRLYYPVQRPYRLRYIHAVFYATAFTLVVLFTIVNVILVGYDTVTVLTREPNATEHYTWWAPKSVPESMRIKSRPGPCQETKLDQSTVARTNSTLSMFSYQFLNSFPRDPRTGEPVAFEQSTRYQANPLDSCRIQTMALLIEVVRNYFEVEVVLHCNQTEKLPRDLKLSTMFKSSVVHWGWSINRHNTIWEWLPSNSLQSSLSGYYWDYPLRNNGSNPSSLLSAVGVLDALSADLHNVVSVLSQVWASDTMLASDPEPPIAEEIFVSFLPSVNWDNNNSLLTEIDGFYADPGYSKGEWWEHEHSTYPIRETWSNLFVALRDTIYLDLGYIAPNNIFTNKTAFDTLIQPSLEFQALLETYVQVFPNPSMKPELVGPDVRSLLNGTPPDRNLTWAQTLLGSGYSAESIVLPISFHQSSSYPAVLNMSYLCPIYQRKGWGSLIMSVFTGTLSMCATAYGLFLWIGPILDRYFYGTNDLRQNLDQDRSFATANSMQEGEEKQWGHPVTGV